MSKAAFDFCAGQETTAGRMNDNHAEWGVVSTDTFSAPPDGACAVQPAMILPITVDSEIGGMGRTVIGMEKFIIPDEGEEALLDESELDMDAEMGLRIRKPGPNEFFIILISNLFTANMLYFKENPESMDEQLLYVDKALSGKIPQGLRPVKFFLCRSCSSGRFFIWPVKVSDTNWYHSLEVLFRKPEKFLKENAVRVVAIQKLSRYDMFFEENSEAVNWPTEPMGELIGKALGQKNIINNPVHPIYKALTAGTRLQ